MADELWKITGKKKRRKPGTQPEEDLFLLEASEKIYLSLEHFCFALAVLRLIKEGRFQVGKPITFTTKETKLSETQKNAMHYAYLTFNHFLAQQLPNLKSSAKGKFIKYLMIVALVEKARFCSCTAIFTYFKKDFRIHYPVERYQSQSPTTVRKAVEETLKLLQNQDNLQKILHLLSLTTQ